MATLSHIFRKIVNNKQINPVLVKKCSTYKCSKSLKNVWTASACVIGGSVLLYAAKIKFGNSAVYALKTKVGF